MARLLAEYGPLVLVVYLCISALSLVGFAWAIERGFKSSIDSWSVKIGGWLPWLSDEADTAGTLGTWTAAWVATKLIQPLRIPVTVAITALIHRLRLARRERKQPPS